MAELPKLTSGQRELLRIRLVELTGGEWMDDGELTTAEKTLIEERIVEHQRDPSSGLSLEEIESRYALNLAREVGRMHFELGVR